MGGHSLKMSGLATMFDLSNEAKIARELGLNLEDLEDIFSQFDKDGSGTIDKDEFGSLMASMDVMLDPGQLAKAYKDLDTDEDGNIDFKEFVTWWVQDPDFGSRYGRWGGVMVDIEVDEPFDREQHDLLYGWYDYDYNLDEAENDRLEMEFLERQQEARDRFDEEKAKKEAEQEQRWQEEIATEERNQTMNLMKGKLMAPILIRQFAERIKELAGQNNNVCSNAVTVQVGQPEDRGHVRIFSEGSEDWHQLNAPPNTTAAAVIDFALREDYCKESVQGIQEIVAGLFEQFVAPQLSMVNSIPKALRQTGMIKGKPFDSYRLEVEEVNGREVLRLAVFSGVDALGGLAQMVEDDEIAKLMPHFSFKFTSGFGLTDLAQSGATLKDMLQMKIEYKFDWVKNYIMFCYEAYALGQKCAGQVTDESDRRILKQQKMAITSFLKFFTAQRSLFYFQFASVFEWARGMIHDVGIPFLLEKIEETGAPILKGPPSADVINNIIDAVGNISGRTLNAFKTRLQSDARIGGASPLRMFKEQIRLDEAVAEAAREDGAPEAKMIMTFWDLATKVHRVIDGLAGVRVLDKYMSFGAEFKDLNFMRFVPSPDEVEQAPEGDGMTWVEQYVRSFQGDPSVERPDADFLQGIIGEFDEIVAIVAAAYPLIECVNMDFLNEQSGGFASKIEEETTSMFNLV